MGQERKPPPPPRCHVFPLDIALGSALKSLVRFLPRELWEPLALGGTGDTGNLDARAAGSGLETQGHYFCADHSAQLRLNIFICKMGTNKNTLFPGWWEVRQCVEWAWHAAWHEKCPLSDLSLLLLTLVPCLPCARPCADHFV